MQSDPWTMEILKTVNSLNLPDWWICAGFVRSKIWDHLHGFSERTPIPDIDVVYFDQTMIDEVVEKNHEAKLSGLMPNLPWSVKNEARMHIRNNMPPYTSSVDAISKFPETATALGVTLDGENNVILAAPWGISDVVRFEIRPTPFFSETEERMKLYENRVAKKNWKATWDKIKVYSTSAL